MIKTRRYILAGLLAIIPLWITWLVLRFLFQLLVKAGAPAIQWLASKLPESLKGFLESPLFTNFFSILLVVAVLYGIGRLTTIVVGRRVLGFFEAVLARIPIVNVIYGAVKKLVTVLQEKPGGGLQRVVLIDFPSPEMKTVGLVTRVLTDTSTGRELAAVYVPTTPNPTSGYLEIVPLERVTSTDWTLDEAMAFIMSGGAVAPDTMNYDHPPDPGGE
ncbi:MAG: hypothetical protein CMN03_05695 [Roseibacillus sp.]|jgi:uncharacterized membrane protein|nr:hypothetical protein [Roseibacillus sp.]